MTACLFVFSIDCEKRDPFEGRARSVVAQFLTVVAYAGRTGNCLRACDESMVSPKFMVTGYEREILSISGAVFSNLLYESRVIHATRCPQ